MRKIRTLLVLSLVCHITSFGKSVSLSAAKNAGFHYLQQKTGNVKSADDLRLSYTSSNGAANCFYVFSGPNSFVIVSADDAAVPVLAYSAEHAFSADHMPSNISAFLGSYNKQIAYLINNSITATASVATEWSNLAHYTGNRAAARTTVVTPLLGTITWNQYPYYNADCPADPGASAFGGRDVAGCVATATAQVMKFWAWPATGTGLHSYPTTSYGTLSADFAASVYNWSAMPARVTAPNAAVAKLISDVGIAVDMNYTPDESSAYVTITGCPPGVNNAEYALKTYFNYDPALHGEERSSYADATWISMLKANLDLGEPIIYDGHGTGGGHCFVFDGYDASSNFHVNWGWDGTDNGYYTIDALDPAVLGVGGGGGGFDDGQEAILGIKPAVVTGGGGALALQLYDNVNLSASTINYYNPFTTSTNFENTGTASFTGDFCAAAFDFTTGSFISYIDSDMGETLPVGYIFSAPISLSTTGLLALLPGSYSIRFFYRPTGGSWTIVPGGSYTNAARLDVVNHNYLELTAPMTPISTPAFQVGAAASVTLNVTNYSAGTYTGNYYLSLYNLDGTFNSSIDSMTSMTLPPSGTYSSLLTFTTPSVTAAPGTYLLGLEFTDASGIYLAGTDYFENPVYVTVVAPPAVPDVYEVNNTVSTAYNLTPSLTWTGDVAHTNTVGSNFHTGSDEDYYQLILPAGYNYDIAARVNDINSTDDGLTYTVDAIWSYSTDGGTTWSSVYDDVMTGPSSVSLTGLSGGTVIFHVSHSFPGTLGTYLLKISNITRTNPALSVPAVNIAAVSIYPNPASEFIAIDCSGTGVSGISAKLTDMQGKEVYTSSIANQPQAKLPLNGLAPGIYLLEVITDAGVINKKITVSK